MKDSQSYGPIILVEGIIGSGKSTLSKHLAKYLGYRCIQEPVDHVYLGKYYQDPERWGFPMQMDLMHKRYALQQLAIHEALAETEYKGSVLDRGLIGDRVFCKLLAKAGYVSDIEWDTYQRAFNIMSSSLTPPSKLVYLDVKPEVALERIRTRAREIEDEDGGLMSIDYLIELYAEYNNLLNEITSQKFFWCQGIKIVRIPWNDAEYDLNKVIEALNNA